MIEFVENLDFVNSFYEKMKMVNIAYFDKDYEKPQWRTIGLYADDDSAIYLRTRFLSDDETIVKTIGFISVEGLAY